jgi:transposase
MSNSWLYHGFGIRGYRYVATRYESGAIVMRIEAPRESLRCPCCGSSHVHIVERFRRRWRTVPVGAKAVWIEMDVPRIECQKCRRRRRVEVTFAEPMRRHTRSFERYVIELLQFMTPQDVSLHLGISWDLANDIQKRRLGRRFGRPKLRGLKRIAIDEIHLGKRHRFVTLVLDLDSGAVVFVGQTKGAEALKSFWKRLKASHAKVRAVATDLSAAYITAVQKHLPKASLVFDRFHLMKLFNEKLTELRRLLFREAQGLPGQDVLKGIRWLLLKNPENLDDAKDERTRLKEALDLNKPLATAYYLKEDLRQFWEQTDWVAASKFLERWCAKAEASGIRLLQTFAKTLLGHRTGLLAWYHHPISTGPLEGVNNKIKLLQRRAYGYRDMELFKLRILSLHITRFELIG